MARAGDLRHRVTIERPVEHRTGDGDSQDEWTPIASGVPASVEETGAREVDEARKLNSRVSALIHMRYYPGLAATHRIVHEGRAYGIVGATNPDGRRRWHRIEAEAQA